MRTVEKTLKRVTIEITHEEILEEGFDKLWDKIREHYPESKFVLENSIESDDKKIILMYLKKKK